MFRVIFVMDIFNRNVVLAKGGIRENYRPVSDSSGVCSSPDPVEIVEVLQPLEVYIADLNVLQGGNRNTNSKIIRVVSSKAETMLDFGVSSPDDAEKALSIANTAVIGTETGTFAAIRETSSLHPGRISVSIDIKHGKVLKQDPEVPSDPFEIVEALNGLPLKDLILLDMDRVGTASGFDPAFLGELALRSKHDVLLGGGVRSMEDLYTLGKIGVKGALVATAVHNGSIPLEWLMSGVEIE